VSSALPQPANPLPRPPPQEVPELSTREVLIIHHTDCGAQAAMRHHDHLVARMKELLAHWNILGWALQVWGSLSNLVSVTVTLGLHQRLYSNSPDNLRFCLPTISRRVVT
jgi:hypothetical protein